MKKFKHFFSLLLVSSVLLSSLGLTFSSCGDMSKEPTPVTEKLYFPAEGGSQTVEIRSLDGSKLKFRWSFFNLHSIDSNGFPNLDDEVDFESDILPDGRMQITSEWVSYTISKDQQHVEIKVSPNPTSQPRAIGFDARGQKMGFFIKCYQQAGASSTEKPREAKTCLMVPKDHPPSFVLLCLSA